MRPDFFKENFERILESCKFIFDNGYFYIEQDALNYLFSESYLKLPYHFNIILLDIRLDIRRINSSPYRIEKAIYHYAGAKPDLNTDDVFNRLYFEYFLKTPWANADMFGNLDKALNKMFRQSQNESRDNLLHFTNLLTERKRAFFVDNNFLESAKQIFAIKDDELIMASSSGGDKFLSELENSKGKVIFFLLINNYWQARAFLLSQGFIEGTDFINGFMFLSERHGLTFNFDSKPIVQEM